MIQPITGANAAMGPLRTHPQNARYFADSAGKPVYLTGSHTGTACRISNSRKPGCRGP